MKSFKMAIMITWPHLHKLTLRMLTTIIIITENCVHLHVLEKSYETTDFL